MQHRIMLLTCEKDNLTCESNYIVDMWIGYFWHVNRISELYSISGQNDAFVLFSQKLVINQYFILVNDNYSRQQRSTNNSNNTGKIQKRNTPLNNTIIRTLM